MAPELERRPNEATLGGEGRYAEDPADADFQPRDSENLMLSKYGTFPDYETIIIRVTMIWGNFTMTPSLSVR